MELSTRFHGRLPVTLHPAMFRRLTRLFAGGNSVSSEPERVACSSTNDAVEWKNRGNDHFNQGDLDAAADCYRRSLAADPGYAEAYNNLGLVLLQQGKAGDALATFQLALARSPRLARAHLNRGRALKALGRHDEAIACLRASIAGLPEFAEAHYDLGNLLLDQRRPADAVRCLERAIQLKPDFAEAYNDLGLALKEQGMVEHARDNFEQAVQIKPDYPAGFTNLGALMLSDFDRPDEAARCLRRAIALDPGEANAQFNLARALFSCGRLADAWIQYEYRYSVSGESSLRRQHSAPAWAGEALTDKTILLWGDQGIGDEILFANMIPDVIAGSRRCVVECADKLARLFAHSFPDAIVVPRTDPPHRATYEGVDVQIAVASAGPW